MECRTGSLIYIIICYILNYSQFYWFFCLNQNARVWRYKLEAGNNRHLNRNENAYENEKASRKIVCVLNKT